MRTHTHLRPEQRRIWVLNEKPRMIPFHINLLVAWRFAGNKVMDVHEYPDIAPKSIMASAFSILSFCAKYPNPKP